MNNKKTRGMNSITDQLDICWEIVDLNSKVTNEGGEKKGLSDQEIKFKYLIDGLLGELEVLKKENEENIKRMDVLMRKSIDPEHLLHMVRSLEDKAQEWHVHSLISQDSGHLDDYNKCLGMKKGLQYGLQKIKENFLNESTK